MSFVGTLANYEEQGKEVNEISMYSSIGRIYTSPRETAWCLFEFEIHYRILVVKRLSFHLDDEMFGIHDENWNGINSIKTKIPYNYNF